MPRPEFSSARSGGSTSKNPFKAWAERRKEAKQAAAEQAARSITNDTAHNEATLVDTLAAIDFLHSRLPKAVLEAKSDEAQPCGDLEYAARALRRMIIKNPQTISVDLRKIDEKLLILAYQFKEAVEQGDERAAYAAKAGLVRGLNNIRCRVPENQPELSRLFVENNEKYLQSWITLVGLAQVADRMKQNVDQERVLYDDEVAKSEASVKALEDLLTNDPAMRNAFKSIADSTMEERARWSDDERNLHMMMIERRMSQALLNLKSFMLTQGEQELAAKVGQVETLYAKVAKLPIVADPNLMNKYREQIDLLFAELAASDAEVDETLKLMDDIDGRIEQLNNAPGAVRAREVVSEQAEEALEEIRRKQAERCGLLNAREGATLKELGLHTKEELDVLQQQLAAEEARIAEEALQDILEEVTESNQLYN